MQQFALSFLKTALESTWNCIQKLIFWKTFLYKAEEKAGCLAQLSSLRIRKALHSLSHYTFIVPRSIIRSNLFSFRKKNIKNI